MLPCWSDITQLDQAKNQEIMKAPLNSYFVRRIHDYQWISLKKDK